MSSKVILSVEGIVKQFPGTLALNDVHLTVHEGEAHAVVGENGAGKSTLMNIISGVFKQDKGNIEFLGNKVDFNSPAEAQDAGIGFVHQELSLCPHMEVSENIFMGRLPKTGVLRFIDKKELYDKSKVLLERLKADFSPNEIVKNLTIAQQQIVEIARAISLDCKLLILDEPTSSLAEQETKVLFQVIREIKQHGIGIFYISHRLEEIFEICDSVTVLRDGCFIGSNNIKDVTSEQIIKMMIGREIRNLYPKKSESIGETVLQVKNFNRVGSFENISFSLKKGEILGMYGLIGAGRTEVARAICGIDPIDSGELLLNGKPIQIDNYKQAIENGFAYLTEDRKDQGLFLDMSVRKNISAADLEEVRSGLFVDNTKEKKLGDSFVSKLNIKVSSSLQKVNSLSGGNQQKVMIGKWLAINPNIIIMDEPTKGIDVGAKHEIHVILRELSNQGVCVVVISSELPGIIGISDRILVMHEGIISGEIKPDKMNEENIITCASTHIMVNAN